MRSHERARGLLRSPRLFFDAFARGRYGFIYDRMPIVAESMSWAKRINLVLAGTHMLRRQVRPRNMPLHMQFELTSFCNLRCPMCPAGTRELERGAMAMQPDLFEQVWEEAAPYLLTASLWAWGEPLLHPQLARILRIARRHGVATLLSTNGMQLKLESAREALIEHPPTTLIVAIDGLTDETNSRYRVGARMDPILEGVTALAALKRKRNAKYPVLQMRYIVMRHNEHEASVVEQFARRHGFEMLSLRAISTFDIHDADAVHGGLVPLTERLQPYQYSEGRRQKREGFLCTMPFWFPTLLAGGEVVACEQDHSARVPFGRVGGNRGFRQIWFSEEAAAVRRRIRDERETVKFCATCPYGDRATSDCSLEARQLVPDSQYPGLVASGRRV